MSINEMYEKLKKIGVPESSFETICSIHNIDKQSIEQLMLNILYIWTGCDSFEQLENE